MKEKTMIEPLKQFYCDTCGELIENLKDGWFEWLSSKENGMYLNHGFRICHHKNSCQEYLNNKDCRDVPMYDFTEELPISKMLGFLYRGAYIDLSEPYEGIRIKDFREYTEVFRRLTIPYYEEARIYFNEAKNNGDIYGMNEIAFLRPEFLKRVIRDYKVQ